MKDKYKDILFIIFFGFIVSIFAYTYMKIGKLMVVSDGSFHFSRVEEIYRNLREYHSITFIGTHTFNHSGTGVFLFYPTVFLYPWALLRFIFNPINAYIIWYSILLFTTLVIAYYAMLMFSRKRRRSFFFALIYAIASYHMYLGNTNFVLGEFIAYTFIPLAFMGFYEVMWRNEKKWVVLGVSMALLLYSHVLSTYITLLLFSTLTVLRVIVKKGLSLKRIVALLKSVVLFALLSSFILVPFVTDYMKGNLFSPKPGFLLIPEINDVWGASLNNNGSNHWSLGLVLFIIAIAGWYFVRNSTSERWIYIAGILLLILLTAITPWQLFSKNEIMLSLLGTIQFPYRFITYVTLFLSVSGSYALSSLDFRGHYKSFLFTLAIGVLLSANYYSLNRQILQKINESTDYVQPGRRMLDTYPWDKVIDKNNYNNIFTYKVTYGETDYYPKKANKNPDDILSNTVYVNRSKVPAVQSVANNKIGYTLEVRKGDIVNLPILAYNSTELRVDGINSKYQVSSRGTVQAEASKTGKVSFVVSYQISVWYYILMVVAVITWLSMLVRVIVNIIKNR